MNTPITKLFLISLCFFLLSAMQSSAQYRGKKLSVVYTKWFPYTYQNNGTATGFEIDIFKAVIKKMGFKAEYTIYPWQRCLNKLKHGKADVLISMLYTPEREQFTYYTGEHISISKTMFFKRTGSPVKFTGSYEELKGYTIGVIMGFSYGNSFNKAEYLKKDEAVDTVKLITKLIKGRNDLGAENKAVVNAVALQMGVKDKIQFMEPPIHTDKLYVGFSRAGGLQKICNAFSLALYEFKKNEQYKQILEKYGLTVSDMMETQNSNPSLM